jgi:AbrB family looped-hinge helix DNA binding protein
MKHDRPAILRIDSAGRVVIPAAWRNALSVGPGDTLLARLEGGRLVLTTASERLSKIRAYVRQNDRGNGSPVDELLAERRAEAARE